MNINEITLDKNIIKAIQEMGYESFTPIQEKVLPILLNGEDLIGEAPTGTGKTAAYSLPMLNRLDFSNNLVQALIICPTRELAVQVEKEINKFSKHIDNAKAVVVYGGQNIAYQIKALKREPQIVVGTPGRILDLLSRNKLEFHHVTYLVLDECDEMLDMGFIRDINKILDQVTGKHQTSLFSATISKEVNKIATNYLDKDAKHVKVVREIDKENQIEQRYIKLNEEDKKLAIVSLLNSISFQRAFIFCRTKHKVMQIEKLLKKNTKHSVTCLHGNLRQNQRDKAMDAFRNYECNVMVATDIAARGLDVSDVDCVINYDIPEQDEYYLHRIGRTGRMDNKGISYTFINRKQTNMIKKYEAMSSNKISEYKLVLDAILQAKEEKKEGKKDMKQYLEDLKPLLNKDNVELTKEVEDACKEYSSLLGKEVTPTMLAAAILNDRLAHMNGNTIKNREAHSRSHDESISRNKEKKIVFKHNSNAQRFFINIGAVDGLGKEDLIHFIKKYIPDIKDEDFSDVYIKGTFAFFELPKERTDAIMSGLNNQKFGKRDVHVELSEKEEKKTSTKKDYSRRDNEHRSYSRRDANSSGKSYSSRNSEHRSYKRDDNTEKKEYTPRDNEHRSYAKRNNTSYRGASSRNSNDRNNYSRSAGDSRKPRAKKYYRPEDEFVDYQKEQHSHYEDKDNKKKYKK